MADYQANVTADFSGYTSSVQQAVALTKEYTAAHEGMMSVVTKTGAKTIIKFNDVIGLNTKLLKANVSEAANYQQAMGKVAASAKAGAKDVDEVQKTTKQIARRMTGDINTAADLVNAVQKSGFGDTKRIKEMSKAVVDLGAATGESGTQIADSLRNISQSYTGLAEPKQIAALGDSLVTVTSQFGASATAAADFSKNVAPFAEQVGMSKASLVGFSTAFARMGESGYRSSNVFAKVLSDIDLAVREGLPTLSTYATAMGKTYEETMQLAKSDPTEFVIQFTESLQKQGGGAIRTLEALGLEGVKSQKAIAALTSTTDLRDMIDVSRQAYGSGSTSEAAAEQLTGLNEQTMKLQESMKQLVVDTGAPMLGWLEDVAGLSTKAADALAGLAESDLFQFLAGTGGMAMAAGGLAFKGLNMAWTAGGIGAAMGQINAMGQQPGQPGRVERGMGFIGANRGKLMGAGALGLMAAPMLDQPGLGTLGMGALMAGTMIGPQTFGKSMRALNFLTNDSMKAWQTPFTQWSKRDFSLDKRVMLPGEYDSTTSRFKATGSADQRAIAMKQMKAMGLTDEAKLLSQSYGYIDPDTKKMAGAGNLARINDEMKKGANASTSVIREQTRLLATQASLVAGTEGQAALRARAMARAAGGVPVGAVKGLGTQLGALGGVVAGMGPVGWGIGAAAVAAGGGFWLHQQSEQMREQRRSKEISGREEAYESFGLIANTFDGIVASGSKVTSTFQDLAAAIENATPKQEEGGVRTFGLTEAEFANVEKKDKSSTELTFQNDRFLWQTTGRQQTSKQATAELIGTYGAEGTPEQVAMMVTDLKAMGKDYSEVNDAVNSYYKAIGSGPQDVFKFAIEDWKENESKSSWNEETFDDTLRATFADYGDTFGQPALAGMLTEELSKQTGELSQSQLDELQGQFAEALPGMENLPDLISTQQRMGESESEWKNRVAEDEAENQRRIQAWQTDKFGRPIGALESKFLGITPETEETGTTEGVLFGRMREEVQRQSVAEAAGTEYEPLDKAAEDMVEHFSTAIDDWKEGETGENKIRTQTLAAEWVQQSGSVEAAMTQVREAQQEVAPESRQGQILAGMEAELGRARNLEMGGMSQWGQIQARKTTAQQTLTSASAEAAGGNKSAEVQTQIEEGAAGVQTAIEEEISWMQNFLKAKKSFDQQQIYAEEDFQRSMQYANEDYATQVSQAKEQYAKQRKYAQEDYNRQAKYAEEDFQKQMLRSDRDYYKQRTRMMEQYERTIARRAEAAAKSMYDPFQRMAVEQTWSAEGLLSNLSEQLEAFQKQAENLKKLKGAGVSQGVIDMLGLNDPAKAQQLERMLGDIEGLGPEFVAQLNAMAGDRVDIAAILFGEEYDMGARQMAEDFKIQLDQMAADRNQWVADAEADYDQARLRNETAFNTSMTRMGEAFETQMRYMATAHQKATERMTDNHLIQMERAREGFDLQFETFTTNYEALSAATTLALQGETPKWGTVVVQGTAGVVENLKSQYGPANQAWMDALTASVEAAWGKDSNMAGIIEGLVALLGATGSSVPHSADTEAPSDVTKLPGGTSSNLDVTAGIGRESFSYGEKGHAGIDIAAPIGTPIYAMQAGKVLSVVHSDVSYGNHVWVKDEDENVKIVYGHMSKTSVIPGMTVGRGSKLGEVGWSGNVRPKSPQGAHVHVEARKGAGTTSPAPWMAQGGVAMRAMKVGVGEAGPEAVVPLNGHGVDILSQAMEKAFGAVLFRALERSGSGSSVSHVSYTTNEDHSVNVMGPVEVVSDDPARIGRELERAARMRAVISPNRAAR